jgi:hypothetical protein
MKRNRLLRILVLPVFAATLALAAQVALADPIGTGATNATVPGCDSKVLQAMGDKANARVAYDVASTEQVVNKPDSILALTCFNNQAGEASSQLGQMFSGDYTTPLSKIIPDSLTAFYDDFQDAPGKDTGTIDYSSAATTLGASGDIKTCNGLQDLWTKVDSEGIENDVPYYRYSDLVNAGSTPSGLTAAGSKFTKDWNTSDGTDNDFGKVNTDITNLTKANTPTTFIADPVNTDDVCATMTKASITLPSPCP